MILSKLSIIKELWQFLKARKKLWLFPMLLLLILLGLLIVAAETSVFGPMIYAIF